MLWIWLLISLGCCGYFIVKKKHRYWEERGVPYIKHNIRLWKDPLKFMNNAYVEFKTKKANFGGSFLFTTPIVLVADLDLVTNILVKDFKYFEDRLGYFNLKDNVQSGSPFFSNGQQWKKNRRNAGHMFTSLNMKMLHRNVVESTEDFHKHMVTTGQMDGEVDLGDVVHKYVIETSGNILFGSTFNVVKHQTEFKQLLLKFKNILNRALLFITSAGLFPNMSKFFKMKVLSARHEELFTKYINNALKLKIKNGMEEFDFSEIISRLQNAENSTYSGATIQTMLLFFISELHLYNNSLIFAIYELALNQEIQDRAREEVRECLEKYDGKCTYEACAEMKYLDQIIHETLRKYPAGVAFQRTCTENYKVPGTSHVIEKGTPIVIFNYAFHHDPEIYPDPQIFDPERFTKEAIQARHPNAWLPFGAGPRFCIGKRLSMLQLTVALASFLTNYRIQTSPRIVTPLKIKANHGFLTPEGNICLKFDKI